MSKTREKALDIPKISKDQAEDVLSEFANADAQLQELTAEMDQQMIKIRDQYSKRIEDLGAIKEEKFKTLHFFATQNKKEFFTEKKKSIDFLNGVIGFRTGTPKVSTLKGITFKAALEMMKKMSSLKSKFVVTKEEINKEAIIALRDDKKIMDKISTVGLSVIQDETFYVDLKKEEATV
jgi:phage host-nuclease inhibitor protein Gam